MLYAILLFWRWSNASSPFAIGIVAFCSYLIIITALFYESHFTKKKNGGFITMKELFKPLFISVLIFELFYTVYNFIHYKYIDPNIIAKMKTGAAEAFARMGNIMSEKDKQDAINKYDTLIQYTQPLKMLQSYITSIAVSGSIAALVAFIMKKNPTVAE